MAVTSSQTLPKPNGSSAPKKRQGLKALLATSSLAATFGGWALLSAGQPPLNKVTQTPTQIAPSILASGAGTVGLPPLPTLVPMPGLPSSTAQPTAVSVPPTPAPTLRAVNQPPPQRIVHVGGGGNSGGSNNSGSGSAPAAAAQTSSSK